MTAEGHRPLSVLLLSDGRPGHFNLSEGIVAALGRRRPLDVRRFEVRRPGWLPARVLSSLVNAGAAPQQILRRVYGIADDALGAPEVIVSAGGNTLAANIAAARLTGAPNIFYGSLRRYRAADFALVMTSYAAQVDAANRLMWLKPSKLDPDEVIGGEALGEGAAAGSNSRLGLIVGGDSGTVRYTPADWSRLLDLLGAVHTQFGTRWIVANGPRTPDSVSDRIAAVTGDGGGAVERFVDFRSAGPGTLGQVLAGADGLLCSADSSSMLSETVWMRRPVIAVAPEDFTLPENEQAYRDWLRDQGWAAQAAIRGLTARQTIEALSALRPLSTNPLDALADELQRRLPGLAS